MKWCCDSARNRFDARLTCGDFLVAGPSRAKDEIWFYGGFNVAHRQDWTDVLGAGSELRAALESIGISNVHITRLGVQHFCYSCGSSLRDHYGPDGGLLRDDSYVLALPGTT